MPKVDDLKPTALLLALHLITLLLSVLIIGSMAMLTVSIDLCMSAAVLWQAGVLVFTAALLTIISMCMVAGVSVIDLCMPIVKQAGLLCGLGSPLAS